MKELQPVDIDAARRRRRIASPPLRYTPPKTVPLPRILTPEELLKRPYPFRVVSKKEAA